MSLSAVCRMCDHAIQGDRCGIDNKQIRDHAASRYCPQGRFDAYLWLKPIPHRHQVIPADFDPEVERRRLQQGGCCGAPSDTID